MLHGRYSGPDGVGPSPMLHEIVAGTYFAQVLVVHIVSRLLWGGTYVMRHKFIRTSGVFVCLLVRTDEAI